MEPSEAAPDLVGRTSARLLAAGVDRRDRLAALHLLAILDASTDTNGRVRRPLDDLAAEFELDTLSVMRSLDHLERAGAAQRDGAAVVLLGNNPEGLGGMQLADFLEDVRTSFAYDHEEPARRSPWFARSGAALVAAAAAFAVFTLAPATQPAIEQPIELAGSPTSVAPAEREPASEPAAVTTVHSTSEPTTTVAPVFVPETTVLAAETCPTGSPVAEIVDGLVQITNPTDEPLVITAISMGGTTLDQVIEIAAGETVTPDVSPRLLSSAPAIDSWEWSSATVARTCPS